MTVQLPTALPNARSLASRILLLTFLLSLLGGCGQRSETAYEQDLAAWHAQRLERLRAEDGWLTLIALWPLPDGTHTLGADPAVDLTVDADVPPLVGTLAVAGAAVSFTAAPEVAVQTADGTLVTMTGMTSDRQGDPTVLMVGTVRFHVVDRGGSLWLRVRDSQSEVRLGFRGIERFPVDEAWRVTARLRSRGMPSTVPMPNVLGQIEELPTVGVLTFEHDGFTHHLIPVGRPGEPLLIVFADETTGQSTYGGGRFLYTDPPGPEGTVVLDFNRAYNPPCAFTPHATCLQPLPENRLSLAVTAGEKAWTPQR
jgi:uncharacterized protein